MKKILHNYWPVFFILTVWFIFAHPYFFFDLVPFPSRYLVDFFPPWNNLFGMPVKNNAMPDVINQIYPWKMAVVESLVSGELPRWNPYQFAGNPLLANYQSAVFAPSNLLFFVFPFIDAWSISVLLQPLLAGIFMYLFMQKIHVSKTGSLIASISFMFCGFMTVWMAYQTLGYAILYLPLLLYGMYSYMNKPTYVYGGIVSISIALSFFSGHFQTSMYMLLAGCIYLLFLAKHSRSILKIALLCFYMIIGIVIALPQLIPTYELFSQTVRSEYFKGIGGLPLNHLVTIIAPDFFGNPVTRNDWIGNYAEWAAFVGAGVFFLAVFSIFTSDRKKYYFFLLLFVSIVGSVASPVLEYVGLLKIPLISTVTASRMMVLGSFSLAVLSGFGYDYLESIWKNKKQHLKYWTSVGIVVFVISSVWIFLFLHPNEISIKNFILPTVIIGIMGAISYLGFIISKKYRIVLVSIIVLVVAFDMLRFAIKWMPFDEKEYVYPSIAVIEFMQKNTTNERVFQNMGGEVMIPFGLYGLEGYDPLYIKRYGEFARSVTIGEYTEAERSVVTISKNTEYIHDYLDLMGVKYILHSKQDEKAEWVVPVWEQPEKYERAYEDEYYEVYENKAAFDRAYVVFDYQVVSDKTKLLQNIYAQIQNLDSLVYLEEKPQLGDQKLACETDTKPIAEIVAYTPHTIRIDVKSECPGFLILTDNYYPDWKASVNGDAAKIYRANYTLRAVEVPEGDTHVVFSL